MYPIFPAMLATVAMGYAMTNVATAPSSAHHDLTRPVPSVADTIPFDTTQVVITTEDFAQLLTFLQATMHEWNTPAATRLMTKYPLQYRMELGDHGADAPVPPPLRPGQPIPIPDYALIADSIPAVAQGLASAKLTGRRYLQLSRALNIAWVTDQLDRLAHDGTPHGTETTTVIGKNVAFIRSHRSEFDRLVELGLDVVTMRTGSGASGDLNP